MRLANIFHYIISLTSTFNPLLIIALFLICSIGEFSFSIPYLLETIWLLSGYHIGAGLISPLQLLLLEIATQSGKQVGVISLYYLSRFGSVPIIAFYRKRFPKKGSEEPSRNKFLPRQINILSPFSVALGRLIGFRIPLTLTFGVNRKLKILSSSVFLSSLAWDNSYILLGVIGGHTLITPLQMLFYSLAFLTVLYLITFIIKRNLKYF